MSSPSFTHMAVVTASTKRDATMSSGLRGSPTTYLSAIKVTPIDPLSAELQTRLALKSPFESYQCLVQGSLDIREGDVLVVGTQEYPIRAVEDWTNWCPDGSTFRLLILEKVKT